MSDNEYRIPRFKSGDQIFAKDLERLRDGARANTAGRSFRCRTLRTAGNTVVMPYATTSSNNVSGGVGYKIKVVSGSGTTYAVEVDTGFPFVDTAETKFSGTLTLLYTIESDLPVNTELFAVCYIIPDSDPVEYDCYVAESIFGLY